VSPQAVEEPSIAAVAVDIAIENEGDGVETTLELRYGAEPIRLPGRDEKMLPVLVSGYAQQPTVGTDARLGDLKIPRKVPDVFP